MIEEAQLVVRRACTADEAARDRFVECHPRGTFFHLSGWGRVITRVMRHEPCDLLAWQGEELVGVLPLMRCRGLLRGVSLISMPYAVYGGPLGSDADVEQRLFEAAEREGIAAGAGRLELRTREEPSFATAGKLVSSDLYCTFIKDLPDSPEEVLKGMPKKARAEARKARDRNGLELSEGIWFLEDLMRLFHRNKRSLGSPGLPPALFQGLRDEFGDRVRVHLVRRGPEAIAAVMSFLFRDTVLAYYSGSAEGADRNYSASNFLYLALQEWSVANGFRQFDFGRSRRDAGAFKFKTHQGFEAQPLHYRYRLIKDADTPSLTPSNPKTKVLRETWSRLPIWLTRRLSTPASRYLP